VQTFPKSLKRIAGWLSFLSIATFLFMFMLGLIMRSDWLTDNAWFALLICVTVVVIVILYLPVRCFFTWRNFRRLFFVFASFIALLILFYAEEDFRGWRAWNKFKQQEEAKGENFNHFSFAPPSVPDEQNFALTPIVASSYNWLLDKEGKKLKPPKTNYIDHLSMSRESYGSIDSPTNYAYWAKSKTTDLEEWQNYYRAVAAKTNEFPVAPTPQSPAADVLLALSKYDSDIEEIRKASALPYSRFPLNYSSEHPFEDILLPHLAALKRCSQVLELRACAELENNQNDKALADVKLMFRLADSIQNEPFLISHLVRIAMTSIALQPVWEGLVKHKWSDVQLAELERALAALNFLNDYEFTMRNERAGAILEIDSMRRHRDYKRTEMLFNGMRLGDESEPSIEYSTPSKISEILCCSAGLYLMPSGWYFENELTVAEMHRQCFLPMIDTNLQVALPKIRNEANEYFKKLNPGPWNLIALFSADLRSSGRKFAYGQNAVNMARVACALERFRLAHDEYPETLDALTLQFITQIPHDVIGGQPLHYQRVDGGKFLLYSIGWNETDDNGQIGLKETGFVDNTKGDWVWPNP
jgi:hypothetical protein